MLALSVVLLLRLFLNLLSWLFTFGPVVKLQVLLNFLLLQVRELKCAFVLRPHVCYVKQAVQVLDEMHKF